MKKNIAYIILLICLFANIPALFAQETRVTGTLKVHPWINLPVVVSTDVKGGLQSLGSIDLTSGPTTILNATVPEFKREIGMVTAVIDPGKNNKSRYFEYTGANIWREIFVIYGWEAGRVYTKGDYVEHLGNFYVAASDHTSSATFDPDFLVSLWNNAGGKDGKYTMTELQMDNKKVTKIATTSTVVAAGTEDSTLVTVGYLNGPFNGKRPVTRPGLTGISGVNFNSATLADFLNKVFFPTPSPYFTSFKLTSPTTNIGGSTASYQDLDPATQQINDYPGSITVPYDRWSAAADFTFRYDILQQDVTMPVTKVEIFSGTTDPVNLLNTINGSLTGGSIKVPKLQSYSKIYIKVTDAAGNEKSLLYNTTFTPPTGVTISNVRISGTIGGNAYTTAEGGGTSSNPWLIERTGLDQKFYLNWSMAKNNDLNVTDVNFTGSPVMANIVSPPYINIATHPDQVTFLNSVPNTSFAVGVNARGDVANVFSAYSYSSYYQLRDKLYCGYLPSDVQPTEAQIKSLQMSSLNTAPYYTSTASSGGVTLANNTGGSGFFTWAVPTYSSGVTPPLFTRSVFVFAFGSWQQNTGEGTNIQTYFVKTSGANATWYWVCIYKASAANGNSIQAKLEL